MNERGEILASYPIKVVIFDLGGVISVEAKGGDEIVIKEVAERLGVNQKGVEKVWNREVKPWISGEIREREFLERVAKDLGRELPDDFPTIYEILDGNVHLNPMILALIRMLRDQGIEVYILSNLSQEENSIWERLGAFDQVDGTIRSFEIGKAKPEAAIYQKIRELFQKRTGFAFNPSKAVYIDDVVEYVEAAEELGMHGIHYTGDFQSLTQTLMKLGIKSLEKLKVTRPLISIITVNLNGGEVFRQCLESLVKIDYPRWELIVVDNGSTDNSEKLPQNYQLPVISYQLIKNKKNLGFAKANNQGYEEAKGEYILLLNNDTKVEPDFLTKLVDRMKKDKKLGVVQPKIYLMDKPGYLDNAGSFFTRIGFFHHWGFLEKDGPEFEKEREIFSAKGACMLLRREVIEKVGLFDEDFVSYFEETDFCWRVWLVGYKVLFYPKAKIYHKVGYTIRRQNVLEINYHYYKNRITSLVKNLEPKNLFIILPTHLFISLGITTAFLLRLKPENAITILRAMFWNLVNIGGTLKQRVKVQKLRQTEDARLFRKLMHPINWRQYFADFKRIEEDVKRKSV